MNQRTRSQYQYEMEIFQYLQFINGSLCVYEEQKKKQIKTSYCSLNETSDLNFILTICLFFLNLSLLFTFEIYIENWSGFIFIKRFDKFPV